MTRDDSSPKRKNIVDLLASLVAVSAMLVRNME